MGYDFGSLALVLATLLEEFKNYKLIKIEEI